MEVEVGELSDGSHRCEIDDVPVYWQQGSAPLSGGLCFAVGRQCEDFANGSTTHQVGHLVTGALPKNHPNRNASVGPSSTMFAARP